MFIQTATFTVPMEEVAHFEEKMRRDAQSMDAFACVAHEVWVNSTKSGEEYTTVSKWTSKKDFQAWLGRPAHLEEHRMMAKERKEHPELPESKITKTMKSYWLYEGKTAETD